MKTSIIVTSWNKVQFMAACGMACINSIRAFTDPSEYELIVIETGIPLWDGHGTLGLEDDAIYIKREKDQGNSADMNQGAKLATGDYLCFVENDVIFHPNWLEGMKYYLDNNLADVVIPRQYHATWDRMKKWDDQAPEEAVNGGMEEAGVLMMKKERFEEMGGWDSRIKKFLMWQVFQLRASKYNMKIITTNKTFISHIGGVSYWWEIEDDKENADKVMAEEVKIRDSI